MTFGLYIAAGLVLFIGAAHSYLGERFILTRLFRRDDLPAIMGGVSFTKRTLRFAWHLTTIAWLGLAGVLVALAGRTPGAVAPGTHSPGPGPAIGMVVGVTFLVHGAVALFASRGRHLSWIVFLAIGTLAILGTR